MRTHTQTLEAIRELLHKCRELHNETFEIEVVYDALQTQYPLSIVCAVVWVVCDVVADVVAVIVTLILFSHFDEDKIQISQADIRERNIRDTKNRSFCTIQGVGTQISSLLWCSSYCTTCMLLPFI